MIALARLALSRPLPLALLLFVPVAALAEEDAAKKQIELTKGDRIIFFG
jgi:hypothetical protein